MNSALCAATVTSRVTIALVWEYDVRSGTSPNAYDVNPAAAYDVGKAPNNWLAWFAYQKFWLLTPLDRVRRDLGERGIPLAMGTLVSFIERAADLLSGIDGLHWKQLLASHWMATDGTGL